MNYACMVNKDFFPKHQYTCRKGLGTCDALLDIVCVVKVALDFGKELAVNQINFSAAFERVNHSFWPVVQFCPMGKLVVLF